MKATGEREKERKKDNEKKKKCIILLESHRKENGDEMKKEVLEWGICSFDSNAAFDIKIAGQQVDKNFL